jgi:hypothetical protein
MHADVDIDPVTINKMKKMEARYSKNLIFFRDTMPTIYKLVNNNTGKPELTIDPSSQEIHRMAQGMPVYNTNPIQHAIDEVNEFQESISRINYAPLASGIDLRHLIKKNPFTKTASYYGEILEKYNRNTLKPAIKDIMIFGVGMGYHIEMLCQKETFKNITIIEHDVKNIKLSMYCIDWAKILKSMPTDSSLTIHVKDPNQSEFAYQVSLKHHCIRLFPTIGISTIIYNHQPDSCEYNEDKKIIEEFSSFVKVAAELIGPEAQRLFNANENIKNGHKAIDLDNSKIKTDKLIAVVGAGPSLDIYSDIIKDNRDKFFLISSGSALSSLVNLGITPDLHFELEFQNLATDLLKFVNTQKDLSNLDLVCTFESNPGFQSLFRNSYMFIPETSELRNNFHENHILKRGGVTCTNGATSFITRLTNQDIHLFGLDFAYTNGHHHSKTNITMTENLPDNLKELNTGHLCNTMELVVESTTGEKIVSTPGLTSAKLTIEHLISDDKRNFYNYSYGAKIQNTVFNTKEDLIKTICKTNSKISLNLKTTDVDPNVIHRNTKVILSNSLITARNILQHVKNLCGNQKENVMSVISIFNNIINSTLEVGQRRNILSISKTPLLQLFVVLNYTPENKQKEMIASWVNDYSDYINYLDKLFTDISDNKKYRVKEDWVND